jgi:hypothetical protein
LPGKNIAYQLAALNRIGRAFEALLCHFELTVS